LEKVGLHRIQKSIFFGKASSKKERNHIVKKVASFMTEEAYFEDSIILLPIDTPALTSIEIFGENQQLKKYATTHFSQYF